MRSEVISRTVRRRFYYSVEAAGALVGLVPGIRVE